MDYLFFVLVCLIWSCSFILMKKASLMFGPISIAGVGACCGALVIWIFWRLKGIKWDLTRKHIYILCALVPCSMVYPFVLQPFLIVKAGHGFIGMMVSLVPIFTILVSIPILKEYPDKRKLFGVVGGLIGVMILMWDGFDRNISPFYLLIAVTVPLSYAAGNTIISRFFDDVSSVSLSLAMFCIGGLILLPAGFLLESVNFERLTREDIYMAVLSLAALSILARGFASMMFLRIIKTKGALFAGMTTYIIPLGALTWSWLDNETITLRQLASIVVILLMVWVVQSAPAQTKNIKEERL